MIIVVIVFGAFSVLSLYACCVMAGRVDRLEEQQKEEQKKSYEPVWLDDDRRYSGLLSEDEE